MPSGCLNPPKWRRKTSKMEALVLSGGILWPTGAYLGVRGEPRRVPRSIFRAKMRAQGLQNEIKIEPKSHQQIGVFAGSFFEVIVEGFWSQN